MTMMLSMPTISNAFKCSLVCGWGQLSVADTSNNAPSMMFAPQSIVAMRLSCPGASTSDTFLSNFVSLPHFAHFGCAPKASVPSHFGHW